MYIQYRYIHVSTTFVCMEVYITAHCVCVTQCLLTLKWESEFEASVCVFTCVTVPCCGVSGIWSVFGVSGVSLGSGSASGCAASLGKLSGISSASSRAHGRGPSPSLARVHAHENETCNRHAEKNSTTSVSLTEPHTNSYYIQKLMFPWNESVKLIQRMSDLLRSRLRDLVLKMKKLDQNFPSK